MQVPLGILNKSEQKGDDMIDIPDHVHQYVPSTEDGKVLERFFFFFGGNQLTVERATHAQDAWLQSKEQLKKLQGITCKSSASSGELMIINGREGCHSTSQCLTSL